MLTATLAGLLAKGEALMMITYTNSLFELAYWKTHAILRNPVIVTIHLALFFFLGGLLLHDTGRDHSVFLRVFVIGLMLTVVAGMMVVFLFLVNIALTLYDIGRGGKEGHLGPRNVTLTEEKLIEETSANRSEWNLKNVSSITQNRKFIFVFVTPVMFLVIPKRNLPENAKNFYERLTEKWVAARRATAA